jgi:hypothetical protein
MTQMHSYERLLATSRRVNWRLEDIIGGDKKMDFSRPFLPESFARVDGMDFLDDGEKRLLNQIRGHGYLAMFELVERCILPFIDAHTPSRPDQDEWRTPAMSQFAAEEAKHIELFTRFRRDFAESFEVECGFVGPAEAIGAEIRSHGELALAIFVLAIEWATQVHYAESVRGDPSLDPQFKSLLRHHWLEESQHAKLDALVFRELATRAGPEQVDAALQGFLAIGGYVDTLLKQQTALDLASLEKAIGRTLSGGERDAFSQIQHQAMRWTFLGSALCNPGFLEAIGAVSPDGRALIEQVAPAFC